MLSGSYPKIMGILNVTPDSFYDGGFYFSPDNALKHALQMVDEGADIIDIGGESSRPYAEPVSIQQECDRVLPIIEALKKEISTPISIDSYHPQVMAAALAAGADMVNDITALQDPKSLQLVAQNQVPVCLMHMQGTPKTMQQQPTYSDVLQEIYDFFVARLAACEQAGILRQNICLDPGIGFGKNLQHNLTIIANLSYFNSLHCPILIGLSRKSMFDHLLQKPATERLYATLSASSVAALQSNVILRTHDVAATQDLVKVIKGLKENTRHVSCA